jgi:ribosomal protein S18 acetylase RimI-like enzyme
LTSDLDPVTASLAERGLENFIVASGIWARASGGSAWDYPGISCFLSTVPRRAFNQVILSTSGVIGVGDLSDAIGHMVGSGLKYRVRFLDSSDHMLRPRLESLGLVSAGRLPAMVFDGDVPEGKSTGPRVERVTDARGLRDHVEVVAEAFEWEPDQLGQVFRHPIVTEPSWTGWTGYENGTPVAAVQLVTHAGTGGIYYVAVAAEHRRKGYGEAITLVAMRAAAERGAKVLTLTASEYGYPVYKRLGFRDAGYHVGYIPPEVGAEAA